MNAMLGVHRFLVRGERIGDQADRADGALDGVQQRQTGEHPHGELLLVLVQRAPRGDVVGHRHLLRQPEVAGQSVPDLAILLVVQAVPVDGRNSVDQLDAISHGNPFCNAGHGDVDYVLATLQLGSDNTPQHKSLCRGVFSLPPTSALLREHGMERRTAVPGSRRAWFTRIHCERVDDQRGESTPGLGARRRFRSAGRRDHPGIANSITTTSPGTRSRRKSPACWARSIKVRSLTRASPSVAR